MFADAAAVPDPDYAILLPAKFDVDAPGVVSVGERPLCAGLHFSTTVCNSVPWGSNRRVCIADDRGDVPADEGIGWDVGSGTLSAGNAEHEGVSVHHAVYSVVRV